MSTRKPGVRQGMGKRALGKTYRWQVGGWSSEIYFPLVGLDTGGSPVGLPTSLPFLQDLGFAG